MFQATSRNVERTANKTIIIPGHRPVGNRSQLIEYRDMLGEVKIKVQALKK